MKKILFSLILSAFICASVFAYPGPLALIGGETATLIQGSDSSNATVTVLAANTRARYRIYGFSVLAATADTIALRCGSTTIYQFTLPVKTGYSEMFFPMYKDCALNESVNFTKGTAATSLEYHVWYK